MFSCVVAGRLPLPPPQQIDATHAVFPLENAELINHIVVFMTGEQAFPEGYGATVHLMWPQLGDQEPHWQLLGCLQNTKPSAIFRVRDPKRQQSAVPITASLGLAFETLDELERQMQTLSSSKPAANAVVLSRSGPEAQAAEAAQLAAPIAQNVFSYLSSFAPDSAPQAVPLLQRWLDQFQRKLQSQGISFLLRAEGDS